MGSLVQANEAYVAPGMPTIDHGNRAVSRFEFWPLWAMYIPVALQWLVLAIRYRSLTLPLIANPRLPVSGMMGVGKSTIMSQSTGEAKRAILPWFAYQIDGRTKSAQTAKLLIKANREGFDLPFVCKPDIGCRGSGVKLIANLAELDACLSAYPIGARIIVQKLSRYEPEAGVFYVRHPDHSVGTVVSLALKYSPYVVGDGASTLAELIGRDKRAGRLTHLYEGRHRDRLHEIIPSGHPYRLIFANSHSRGSIFRDGRQFITPALTSAIDDIMKGLPDFHYGRLDVRFPDVAQLAEGRNLEVVEINAASSESLHIWDHSAKLGDAYATLMGQYRTLFRIGAATRRNGAATPPLREVIARWRAEHQLVAFHPPTD